MAVTPVSFNQNVYTGTPVQQNSQNAQTNQTIPVGQPVQYNTTTPIDNNNNKILNNLPQSTNSYENDIMMSSIDFNKAAQDIGLVSQNTANNQPQSSTQTVQPQTVQPQVEQPQVQSQQNQEQVVTQQQMTNPQVTNSQQPAFTGKSTVEQTPSENSDLTNCLVDNKGNEKKSNLGMMLGAAAGFTLPFICNKFKVGKIFTKDLLLKVPVMTAGGLCAGGVVEGLTASTKKLQANNLESEMATQPKMDVKA